MLYLVGFVFYSGFNYHLGIFDCILFYEFSYNIFYFKYIKIFIIFLIYI